MARQRRAEDVDDYVQCDECGHPVEEHALYGCTRTDDDRKCSCPARWTKAEIRKVRVEHGLTYRSPIWNIK